MLSLHRLWFDSLRFLSPRWSNSSCSSTTQAPAQQQYYSAFSHAHDTLAYYTGFSIMTKRVSSFRRRFLCRARWILSIYLLFVGATRGMYKMVVDKWGAMAMAWWANTVVVPKNAALCCVLRLKLLRCARKMEGLGELRQLRSDLRPPPRPRVYLVTDRTLFVTHWVVKSYCLYWYLCVYIKKYVQSSIQYSTFCMLSSSTCSRKIPRLCIILDGE